MKAKKIDLFVICNSALMLLFIFVCIYPFYYVIIISLNDPLDAQRGGIYLFIRSFSIENYKAIFKTAELLNAYQITIFRVVVGSLLHLVLTSMFAYALTKKHFVFRKFLTWWMLIPMYFSGGIIPTYVVMDMLGLVNNIMIYVLPHLLATFHILIMRTFLSELPPSLEESAVIDGAGDVAVYWKIIIPLSTPVLATIALFIGVFHWNDWFTGFTYMTSENLWTAQNVLLKIIQTNEASNIAYISKMDSGLKATVTAESVKMAMLVLTTIPVIVVYPFLQKYFVKGMMLGSVKG
ncbi:sugar ABC transporter permease [Paenibacillus baekrokdamisoli]|uniref:Sugar ABC transporter permease n=1 Tax=Paenibacillus baekrokdamisoli TaxID=1712516 RepID=A0A3G9IZG3_9BACL|nr:carbohydrate ABC transporter permease [Paenibacillus baekrokdamisoli]MBB3071127.1 putative aldouronate transport system permease protein [Paenibacillus baekrokdamisoli]BBH21545.1 sugar ABC transporter permease [Paenibacillus baekrokdamisoli]